MTEWQRLCEKINYLAEINLRDEDPLHNAFEKALKDVFQWPKERVKHKPTVKMASSSKQADIVLEGDDFGIIIEIKRFDNELGANEEAQLISYMDNYYNSRNNKKCGYGLLVGKKIRFFHRRAPDERPREAACFPFDNDNPDGAALCEILFFENCSDTRLRAYAAERFARAEKVLQHIRIEETELPNAVKVQTVKPAKTYHSPVAKSDFYNPTIRSLNEKCYWWISEGVWFEKEHIREYIDAPCKGRKGGKAPFHWENVAKLRKGDYILSYVRGDIVAIGIILEDSIVTQESPNSGKKRPGWQAKVSWTNIDKHFHTIDVWEETKHLFEGKKYMPLNYNGTGNQGYLYQIDKEIFDTYLYYIKNSCNTDLSKFTCKLPQIPVRTRIA